MGRRAQPEPSEDDLPEAEEPPSAVELAALRGCWELASLSLFYRRVAPALSLPQVPRSVAQLERLLLHPEKAQALLPALLDGAADQRSHSFSIELSAGAWTTGG